MLANFGRRSLSLVAAGTSAGVATFTWADAMHSDVLPAALASEAETDVVLENWSSTHSARPRAYFQPETPLAVQQIISLMHEANHRLRVVG